MPGDERQETTPAMGRLKRKTEDKNKKEQREREEKKRKARTGSRRLVVNRV